VLFKVEVDATDAPFVVTVAGVTTSDTWPAPFVSLLICVPVVIGDPIIDGGSIGIVVVKVEPAAFVTSIISQVLVTIELADVVKYDVV
jgi:uncharacterized membrane protein